MLYSSLVSFLNGEVSAQELWQEIQGEVTSRRDAMAEIDGVSRVVVTNGPETNITLQQVGVLLAALADASLPLEAASYVADAIIMSDDFNFDDRRVTEVLYYLSDESAPLSMEGVEVVRRRFSIAA